MTKGFLLLTGLMAGMTSFIISPGSSSSENTRNGSDIYIQYCQSCHMVNGEGVEGLYPPLAKTNYVKNTKKIIDIILNGQFGEVKVNNKKYNTDMPAQAYLSDEQIADVLTYVRSSWGNKYPAITPAQVKEQRK